MKNSKITNCIDPQEVRDSLRANENTLAEEASKIGWATEQGKFLNELSLDMRRLISFFN